MSAVALLTSVARFATSRAAGAVGATLAGGAAGAAAWTLTEYATHRWILHGPFGHGRLRKLPLGSVHRHHHSEPYHTVPVARAAACATMLAIGGAAGASLASSVPSLPALATRAAGLAWGAGYSAYDTVHWSLHHRAPRTAAGTRLRQRHFRHHFGSQNGNLGVTTAAWDRLFRTEIEPGPLTLARRHAPEWLDALGPAFSTPVPRAN